MANGMDVLVSWKLAFLLFAVVACLLIHASSQRRELSKVVVSLRNHASQFDNVIRTLRQELDGPSGCNEQVGWRQASSGRDRPLCRHRHLSNMF